MALDPVGRSSADDTAPRGFGDGEVDAGAQDHELVTEQDTSPQCVPHVEPGHCKAGKGTEAEQEPEPSCYMGRIGLMS